MAVNGAPLTQADEKRLAGPPLSTPFDLYERLFPAWDGGRVFDLGTRDAPAIKEMLRQDGQARKVEQVLTLPIRAAAWEIRPAPGGQREHDWIQAQLADKLDRVIDQLTTAISFRKAFFELSFGLDGDTVQVEGVDYRPPATCEAAWDPKTGAPLGFRQRVGNPGGIITIAANVSQREDAPGYVTIPAERAFVFVHGAYREPIEGVSDLDVCLWCYETVKKIQFLWFQFLEQQSLPKTVVYGDDPSSAERNAEAYAEAKASAIIAQQRPADPTARAFDTLESSGAGASQFVEAINYVEAKMSASVLAGFTDLTALASHTRSQGSYALSADQSEFFLQARQAVADEIADAVSRDLFGKLCRLQFGPDSKPPTLSIGPLSKHDKERALQLLTGLLTADHFNAPPRLVDLLIKSTAGYVGLPVDQVNQAVDEHPTQDPALVAAQLKAQQAPQAQPGAAPAGPEAPTGEGGTSVADDPLAAFKRLAGLAHQADEYVARTTAGENPREVVADLTGRDTRRPVKRTRRRKRR